MLCTPEFLRPGPCLPATDPRQCRALPRVLPSGAIVSRPLQWERMPPGPFLIKTNKGWGEKNPYIYTYKYISIYNK